MIGMRVGVHHKLDGLVRNRLLHFRDDGVRRHLILRCFNENDVILHLDGDTSITARDHVDAVG